MREPFAGLFTQGMVTHETYRDLTYKDAKDQWVEPADVELETIGGKRQASRRPPASR